MRLGVGLGVTGWRPVLSVAFAGPLDDLVPAAAAFSLRRLLASYEGDAVRVRRSSDNAEADIGFTAGGDLDTVALLAHCGAGDGYVATWYDQSGNGLDAVQATAARQPRIVNAGVLEVHSGGSRRVMFDGNSHILPLTGIGAAFALSVVGAPFRNGAYCSLGTDDSGFQHYLLRSNASSATSVYVTPSLGTSGGTWPAGELATFFVDHANATTANGRVGKNGGALVDTGRNYATVPTCFGNNAVASQQFGGISELVFFDADLSTTDRQTLEASQGAYYGITLA